MTFLQLSEEQALLGSVATRYLERESPIERVQQTIERGLGEDGYAAAAASLGWSAPFVPEPFGGGAVSDAPETDAAIIAEQRGRFLQPGPFTSTAVVSVALARSGSPAQQAAILPGIAAGRSFGAWAFGALDGTAGGDAAAGCLAVGSDRVLSGAACAVPDAAMAQVLLVSVSAGSEIEQYAVPLPDPAVLISPLDSLDLTARWSRVTFDGLALSDDHCLRSAADVRAEIEHQLAIGAMLTAADSVGAMQELLAMTLTYAKTREAFGRPIGSFQAIKHLLADTALAVNASKAGLAAAVEAMGSGHPDRLEIVDLVASFVADSGFEVGQGCLQVHGGIGYTWEHSLHLYLRRLAGNSMLFGTAELHRDAVARRRGLVPA